MKLNPLTRLPRSIAVRVTGLSLLGLLVTGLLQQWTGSTAWIIACLLCQVVVIAIVIWQACDPFAEAAQWIGTRFRIPGSVRGATLDAIASSMPEFFSGIFFVLVAVFSVEQAQRMQAGSDGYGAVVATCAGSAVYNMILIPAACALVIASARKTRPTIDVAPIVIMRDGMWFLACELVLIVFLFQAALSWWMAVVFIGGYLVYMRVLYNDARRFQRAMRAAHEAIHADRDRISSDRVEQALSSAGLRTTRALVVQVRDRLIDEAEGRQQIEDEAPPKAASVLFGMFQVRLNVASAWMVIAVSTAVAATACYWLVEVTRSTSEHLNVPIFFVAVILAAAASSVPDTFLSIGAAMRGDDDGAVSNVFGSNIFDICICLAVPLLVAVSLNGWQPISLTQDGRPMPGLVGIRVMLCVLTIATLLIMWHNQQLTRRKAWILVALYGVFVAYAVAGSLGIGLEELLQ